jgi:UDP-N-acetylglucosamine 2-epimerase
LRSADARAESEELAAALEAVDGTAIVTLPNDDPGGLAVRAAMLALEERAPHVRTYAALGQHRYLSLLAHADAVVGNSSSAIIEAPSFKLPVVDVGDRQRGRTRAANIRNVPPEREAIAAAIAAALEPAFRASLAGMESPYGDGRVSERVLAVLAEAPLGELRAKRFFDLPDGPWRDLL